MQRLQQIVADSCEKARLHAVGAFGIVACAAEIGVGAVVRWCESDFRMVECFDENSNTCRLSPACRLKKLFQRALASWLRELDTATLADLVGDGAAESLGASAIISLSRRAPAAAALARG